jgi:hypothetical protein
MYIKKYIYTLLFIYDILYWNPINLTVNAGTTLAIHDVTKTLHMKTSTTTTDILLKSIDIELKKQIQKDLEAYQASLLKRKNVNSGNQQAA